MEVMEPLWNLKEATIRQILDDVSLDKRPAYTTVQTIINRLEDKGVVARVKKIGIAHIYRPLISQKSAFSNLIEDFVTIFGGSSSPIMSHLVETGRITLKDLKEIEILLKKNKKRSKK